MIKTGVYSQTAKKTEIQGGRTPASLINQLDASMCVSGACLM